MTSNSDKDLFECYQSLIEDLRNLSAVVQNDHERLIEDGLISLQEVEDATRTFENQYLEFREKLGNLYNETLRRLYAVQRRVRTEVR